MAAVMFIAGMVCIILGSWQLAIPFMLGCIAWGISDLRDEIRKVREFNEAKEKRERQYTFFQ